MGLLDHPLHLLGLLSLGAVLGFAGGLFGIGGGIIAIPVLILAFGQDQATAQGTALVLMVPNLLIGCWRYARHNPVPLRDALGIAAAGTITTWASAHLAGDLDQGLLRSLFALFLLFVAAQMIAKPPEVSLPGRPGLDRRLVPLVGVAGGGSMGLLGIGGALVAIPFLVRLFRIDQRTAQALGLALVAPSSIIALGTYAGQGHVDWTTGLCLSLGGVLTVAAGVELAHRLPERRLRLWFGVMVGLTGIWLLVGHAVFAAEPSPAQREAEDRGRVLFTQVWVPASPHAAHGFEGLGPVFNDTACSGCHAGNGRGGAPDGPEQHLHGMLVRLSLPGQDEHGGPVPVPNYGDQLNERAIAGVAAEGRAVIPYRDEPVTLTDGTRVTLRAPQLSVEDLAFGPLDRVLTSARIAQPLAGAGLLAAIPEADILAHAARGHGRVNRVWDPSIGDMALGRFGWKANQPSLMVQDASAALGDMGLTSALFPDKNCQPAQKDCAAAFRGPQPDLDSRRLQDLTAYVAGLEEPQRRNAGGAKVKSGEALFSRLGCAACHKPAWRTGAGRTIHPYSDLLLHDMGPGLADGRPDFAAGPAEWRTAPLWGLGGAKETNPQAGYLHDGRARTFAEAILWHGGEAKSARDSFAGLPAIEREALLAFLGSL